MSIDEDPVNIGFDVASRMAKDGETRQGSGKSHTHGKWDWRGLLGIGGVYYEALVVEQ